MKAEVAKTPVCLKAKVAKTTEKPKILTYTSLYKSESSEDSR